MEGYGFGAEGDWKTAALYRTTWVMSQRHAERVLLPRRLYAELRRRKERHPAGTHVGSLSTDCQTEAETGSAPSGIGIDSETARLVFTSKQGEGVAATIVDLGNRFRLIVNKVECIKSKPLPKLPVASAL